MKNSTRKFLKTTLNASLLTAVLNGIGKVSGKNLSKAASLSLFIGAIGVQSLISTSAYAFSESDVDSYSRAMSAAANNQNIAQISKLISDDAIIALTRNNKTTSLDKEGYLQLLQKSWAKAKEYQFSIDVRDVVISGSQARAQVNTIESWIQQDGKKITLRTSSRATLSKSGANVVLLRSVSQVSMD